MKRMIRVVLAGCVCLAVGAGSAAAGLNASATAALYWQDAQTGALASTQGTGVGTPQLVVTVKGVSSFRGADVQLLVSGQSGGAVPAAWQCQSGGCNESGVSFYIGGHGGLPNAFTSAPAVPGVAVSQNEELYATGTCATPHNFGLLWLTAAGAAGGARNPATEYAVWAVKFDLRGTAGGGPSDCDGDYLHTPMGVCIVANERIPCNDIQRGSVMAVLDGNDAIDYAPFAYSKAYLEWWQFCTCYYGYMYDPNCSVPVKPNTWGALRRLYR